MAPAQDISVLHAQYHMIMISHDVDDKRNLAWSYKHIVCTCYLLVPLLVQAIKTQMAYSFANAMHGRFPLG